MLVCDTKKSHIVLSSNIEEEFEKLKEILSPSRVVGFINEKFLIEDAKAAVAEAYISESETKYIILGAYEFTNISQNSLLKVLEEPPRNIEFIIISPTKSGLLPTVRSRLAIRKGTITHGVEPLELNLAKIGYKEVFDFLKEHARDDRVKAQDTVEALYYRATVVDMLILSLRQLENFEKAYKLLELNSRPQS
ncbi:MAG: DNA polymerase III subunit delta', partial [Sulfurimonadaceae bacterium]|nr:DNA polymerase III subunit delta' [Sulfurimonadaceae bacterium]